jgi:hypothetical protein
MIYGIEPGWNTKIEECPTCLRHLDKCPCDSKDEE